MSKITIIEGNSNDKDNVRNYMVKGEPGNDGVSPIATVERGTNSATVTVTDAEGTTSAVINDGYSPTVTTSKTGGTTTITITDFEGTKTATINDGEVSEAELTAALNTVYSKDNFIVLEGVVELTGGAGSVTINYPTNITKDNSIVISCGMGKRATTSEGALETDTISFGVATTIGAYSGGFMTRWVVLKENEIAFGIKNEADTQGTTAGFYKYKITLLKYM